MNLSFSVGLDRAKPDAGAGRGTTQIIGFRLGEAYFNGFEEIPKR